MVGDGLGIAAMLCAVRELFKKRTPDSDLHQSKLLEEESATDFMD